MAKKKAKKRKPTAKKKTAKKTARMRVRITCPMCRCKGMVNMPKHTCKSACECPCCKETIEAGKCCILCDYSDKACGACKKK